MFRFIAYRVLPHELYDCLYVLLGMRELREVPGVLRPYNEAAV